MVKPQASQAGWGGNAHLALSGDTQESWLAQPRRPHSRPLEAELRPDRTPVDSAVPCGAWTPALLSRGALFTCVAGVNDSSRALETRLTTA